MQGSRLQKNQKSGFVRSFITTVAVFVLISAVPWLTPLAHSTASDPAEVTSSLFSEGELLAIDRDDGQGLITIAPGSGLKRGDKLIVVRAGEVTTDPRSGGSDKGQAVGYW